jgi:hypothetical protein
MSYTFQEDLREAEAMVRGFEDYLKGDNLYVNIGGGLFGLNPMPSLTTGALVLRLRRLHVLAAQLTPEQQGKLTAVTQEHDAIRTDWRVHYEKKVLWEANSRLDAMRAFFEEAARSMEQAANAYRPELLRRTIVQDLLGVMDALHIVSADLDQKVRQTDGRLQGVATEPTNFLWDSQLEAAYPRQVYWWLYRQPRRPRF